MRRCIRGLVALAVALGATAAPASAEHDRDADVFFLTKLFNSHNATNAVNSDLAFWGDRAYAGNYGGFRIFDISNPASPALAERLRLSRTQNDVVVWEKRLLFTTVDRTQTGPACGSTDTVEHDDPTGWEGVRIFDCEEPQAPEPADAGGADRPSRLQVPAPRARRLRLRGAG